MVVRTFESKTLKPWRPVARPVPKSNLPFLPKFAGGSPVVAPKPGGKVFVYVYEAPGGNTGTYQRQSSSGSLPPNAQLVIGHPPVIVNGPEPVKYPYSDEAVPKVGRQTPLVRLRERSKKSGKGYKLLADVMPGTLRSSSRGGRMFMKQKKRMEKYTSLESDGKKKEEQYPDPDPMEDRATPWNISKVSSAGLHYMPSRVYNSDLSKDLKRKKGGFLAPLPSPPASWRAKVEANYKIEDGYQTLPAPRRWNVEDAQHKPSRCGSAPPPAGDYMNENGCCYGESEDYYQASVNDQRPDSRGVFPTASINFNAKQHLGAPHRKQGARSGRGTFTTTPNVQLDFNAKPVGWSKSYQY